MIADEAFMVRRMATTPLHRPGISEDGVVAAELPAARGAFVSGQNIVIERGTVIIDGG